MYKINYTQESFEEILEQAYSELEVEDINNLLSECVSFLKNSDYYDNFIHQVSKSVWDKRNISFKQWKALSAYVTGCKRKEQSKNNKTF